MANLIFSVRIARNRDLLFARQQARRLAHLLRFGPHGEACIVAGAFEVGHQARRLYRQFDLCYALEGRQLLIYARIDKSENPMCPTVAEGEAKLLRLSKTIPETIPCPAAEDLAWTLGQVEKSSPARLFDEVARQNQETLMLLHELQVMQGKGGTSEASWQSPTAA
jgi:hypothetical protein